MRLLKNLRLDLLVLPDDDLRSDLHIAELVESIQQFGYRDKQPRVICSERNVLDGCRRLRALRWLHDNDRPAFDRALPSGKVPCDVLA